MTTMENRQGPSASSAMMGSSSQQREITRSSRLAPIEDEDRCCRRRPDAGGNFGAWRHGTSSTDTTSRTTSQHDPSRRHQQCDEGGGGVLPTRHRRNGGGGGGGSTAGRSLPSRRYRGYGSMAGSGSGGTTALLAILAFLLAASVPPPQQRGATVGGGGGLFHGWGDGVRLAAYAADDDAAADDAAADDAAADDAAAGGDVQDDDFVDLSELSFEEVSVMPVSCLRYNNGHMIKFEFFENTQNYQCHFKNLGTFVVSIAHYMRAYFNNQALVKGRDFKLPGDAGYLNCVLLRETAYTGQKLYAKIGCMERETFTSTKLQLHVYQDAQCSQPYDDGRDNRQHVKNGYDINGYSFSTKVSFRPPFYTCQTCAPDQVSDTFRKSNSYWYDDDYISKYGKRADYDDDAAADDAAADDAAGDDAGDDANAAGDDAGDDGNSNYYQANDDISYGDDDAANKYGDDDDYYNADDGNDAGDDGDDGDDGAKQSYWYYKGNGQGYKKEDDDDFYARYDDDRRRNLIGGGDIALAGSVGYGDGAGGVRGETLEKLIAAPGQLEAFEREFWEGVERHAQMQQERQVGRRVEEDAEEEGDDGGQYGIGDWNMCERIYHYGLWCDEECRALDTFRVDEWSASDIFLLVIMCLFMAAMMLLVFAKRVKAYEKASIYGDEIDNPYPGLPPMAMVLIFILIMTVILVLANLKFVNETLVFAVVTCILLFIYMLKLTLFESRKPTLLPTPRHGGHYGFD